MRSKLLKTLVQMLIGLLVSGCLLFFLAENVRKSAGELQSGDLLAVVRSIPIWVVFFALICQLAQGSLRALRYQYLLNWDTQVVGNVPQRFRRLLAVTFARNMFVDMLPSRSGELIYVWLIKRVMGAKIANGFTSLGAAFIFDLVALVFLVGLVSGLAMIGSAAVPSWGLLIVLCVFVGAALVGFFSLFPLAMRWTEGFRKTRFRNSWIGSLHAFVEDVDQCIVDLKKRGQFPQVLGLSLMIRFFKYTGIVTMLYMILEHSFGNVGFANLGSIFLGIVAGEASASMPVPSFMSFGTYEAGASFTLQSLGFSLQAVVISIFIVHLMSQIVDYSLGCFSLLVSWLSGWLECAEPNEANSLPVRARRRWILAAGFCVMVFFASVGIVWLQYHKANRGHRVDTVLEKGFIEDGSPQMTSHASSREPLFAETIVEPSLENPAVLKGFAVWASNRFGNHEIVKYDFESQQLEQLTHTSEKEFYPNISPDGRRLVFARAELPDRTPSDLTGWMVIMYDLNDGTERVLSKNSYHPSWAGDNNRVVYTRAGNEVILHDLRDDNQQVILKAGQGGVPSGFEFWTPYFNPESNAVAVTIRGSRRTKMVYSLNPSVAPIEFPDGCQLSWFPGYRQLVFTGQGYLGDNAFYSIAPDASNAQRLLDLPTAYHHLYFPRFSENGKWLIYGASRGDHEHDNADYDVFLWRIGAPLESIVSLASDPGNDSWPDIHVSEP